MATHRARHRRLVHEAQLTDDEIAKLVRNNSIECYGLRRFGVVPT